MNKTYKPSKNLVALRYTLKEYEDCIREELKSAISKAGLSDAQSQQVTCLVESALQNIKSNHFAVEGRVELYQYPLMSLSASGKFKDKEQGMIVYVNQTHLRRAYQRRWVIPRDPKTEKQLTCREQMRLMNQQWKNESEETQEAWNQSAQKNPAMTGKNLYARYWFQYVQTHQEPPGIGFILEEG
jgi:hypothetical protein